MRKALIALLAIGILSTGAVAYAHMWGPGTGPGWGYQSDEGKKFLDETAELRGELHKKMFEYREAWRTGDEKKVTALDKEISGLQEKLYDKAREAGISTDRGFGGGFGPGMMWGYGRGSGPGGYGCQGPY